MKGNKARYTTACGSVGAIFEEKERKKKKREKEKKNEKNKERKKQGRVHGRTVADGLAGAVMQKPLAI